MIEIDVQPEVQRQTGLRGREKAVHRQRKAHHKSRKGCGNCKLRRVKCDEGKPRCQKCKDYGVACSYDQDASDLQLLAGGAFKVECFNAQSPLSLNENMLSTINSPLKHNSTLFAGDMGVPFQVGDKELKLLHMFQGLTVRTIGTERDWPIYRSQIMTLAPNHDFLMHMVLTMTLMHDRFLSPTPNVKRSVSEAYHWYRGTMLYNRALAGPIDSSQKDALWITAALLGCVAFSHIEFTKPTETWPLTPSSPDDLHWLRMSDGKKEVFKLTQPLREGSGWRDTASNRSIDLYVTNPKAQLLTTAQMKETLPDNFVDLYELDDEFKLEDEGDRSPYHMSVSHFAKLMPKICNHSTVLDFLTFISTMEIGFRRLLQQKDPRAMLLLAYWHAKMCTYGQWWLWRRCLLECQSICIYLGEKYEGRYAAEIKPLLDWPRSVCGLSMEFGATTSAHWNKQGFFGF